MVSIQNKPEQHLISRTDEQCCYIVANLMIFVSIRKLKYSDKIRVLLKKKEHSQIFHETPLALDELCKKKPLQKTNEVLEIYEYFN